MVMFDLKVTRRVLLASAMAVTVVLSSVVPVVAQVRELNGAGATFPVPLYQRYFSEYRNSTGVTVNYQGVGSGAGIRQVIAQTVDFGGTDAAMTDAQIAEVGDRGVILVPTAGGAVAVVYNLPGVTNLRLSREALGGLFTGQITRWNDSRIAAANPGLNLPDLPVRPVVRADGSGTTFIFTNHLGSIDPYFRGRVGVGTAPNWRINEIRGRGNPGVASQVQRTRGGVGYVELAYAEQNNLTYAAVENRSGDYVVPSLQTTEQALAALDFPDNFRVFVDDPVAGYPIAGLTWLMIYRRYDTPGTADAVKELVRWVLTDGQNFNNQLDYTRIPEPVAQRVLATVEREVTGP